MKGSFVGAKPSLSRSLWQESTRLSRAWVKHGLVGIPAQLSKKVLSRPGVVPLSVVETTQLAIGTSILDFLDDAGPVYGKACQILMSTLTPEQQELAGRFDLTRLYGDWPPLSQEAIEEILDTEIPTWRDHLELDPNPLGVASMAQAHVATDREGREWVLKVLKPKAVERMEETVAAIESLRHTLSLIPAGPVTRAFLRDLGDLCFSFRREASLTIERETLEKMRERTRGRREKVLVLPATNPEFCSDRVLTMERFQGVPLSEIVAGKKKVPARTRKKLAKSLLGELLIQVFEIGLFHGDPHAGNLILLEDGNVGLFDWGLAGELSESDRRHVASILKAVLALDFDRLIEALYDLANDGRDPGAQGVTRADIRAEVKKIARRFKSKPAEGGEELSPKPSLAELIEACLRSASKLGIRMPDGLMVMAKSLVTIEGLAKGIDPEVPLKRIASPVLLRAAKPGIQDILSIARGAIRRAMG